MASKKKKSTSANAARKRAAPARNKQAAPDAVPETSAGVVPAPDMASADAAGGDVATSIPAGEDDRSGADLASAPGGGAATAGADPVAQMIAGTVVGEDVAPPSADAAADAVDAGRAALRGDVPGSFHIPEPTGARRISLDPTAHPLDREASYVENASRWPGENAPAVPPRRGPGRPRKDGLPPGSGPSRARASAPMSAPVQGATATRRTKDELLRELEQERAERARLAAQVAQMDPMANEQAIAGLSAALAFATQAACDMWADIERAPVLRASDAEARAVGDAVAPVLAPYAQYLGPAIPVGVAAGAIYSLYRQKSEALRLYRAEQGAARTTTPPRDYAPPTE